MVDLAAYLNERRREVDAIVARFLPKPAPPIPDLGVALDDALAGGGKRIRPILVLAVADLLKAPHARVDFLAAAVEFIHSASLALDDLPSMDDSPTRRSQPALHVKHGEALAILAAIALLMGSVEVMAAGAAREKLKREKIAELLQLVGGTCGFDGMAAGQWADLSLLKPGAPLRTVEFIHRRKTGKLFELALRGSAIVLGANEAETAALDAYGKNLGLAFQVKDDLLDREGDAAKLGKPVRKDQGKTTFVDLAGRAAAHRLLDELVTTATDSLAIFGRRGEPLTALAAFVRDRES